MAAKNFAYSVLILLPFVLVSLATSKKKDTAPVPLSYDLLSDCANATVTSGVITITEGVVTDPVNTTFLDFGLPVAELLPGFDNPITGEIAPALTRSCVYSFTTGTTHSTRTFTCSDNGIYACTFTLTRPN